MKKFISAITAIAMTAGVMASMTVVANAASTRVEAESTVLYVGTPDTNSKIIKQDPGITYYIQDKNPAKATLFKVAEGVKEGDSVCVTINLNTQTATTPIEYGMFVDEKDITLSSVAQADVKTTFETDNLIGGMKTHTLTNNKTPENLSLLEGTATSDGYLYVYIGCNNVDGETDIIKGGKIQFNVDYFDVEVTPGSVESPTETKYYEVNLGDNAGSYTKVSVTANNGEKEATVTKDLGPTLTLAEAASVSLGIEITDIPTDGAETFTIKSVTLE